MVVAVAEIFPVVWTQWKTQYMLLACFLVCVGGIFVGFGFLCGFFFRLSRQRFNWQSILDILIKWKKPKREFWRACSFKFRWQFNLIPGLFFSLELYLKQQPMIILVFLESKSPGLYLIYTDIGYFRAKITLYPSNFTWYAEFVKLSVQLKYSGTILKYFYLSNRMKNSKSSSSIVSYLIYEVSVVVPEHL